jgi:carbon monoxide dehydrogenase subunit G
MDLSNDFAVPQHIDQVWDTMTHLERVLPLMPYTTVLEGSGSSVTAQIKVRFGSVSMTYVSDAEVIERDDRNYRAVMTASARQTGGRSCVHARVEIQLTPPVATRPAGSCRWSRSRPGRADRDGHHQPDDRSDERRVRADLATMQTPLLAA